VDFRGFWKEVKVQVAGYREFWKQATSYQEGMIIVLLIGFAAYFYVISEFPLYINDVVVYSIGSTLLTVEGFSAWAEFARPPAGMECSYNCRTRCGSNVSSDGLERVL